MDKLFPTSASWPTTDQKRGGLKEEEEAEAVLLAQWPANPEWPQAAKANNAPTLLPVQVHCQRLSPSEPVFAPAGDGGPFGDWTEV